MVFSTVVFIYYRWLLVTKQHEIYLEKSGRLWTQYIAMLNLNFFIIIEAILDEFFHEKNIRGNKRLHSAAYILQTTSVLIYVVARKPDDSFHSLNRLPQVKYSMFAGKLPWEATTAPGGINTNLSESSPQMIPVHTDDFDQTQEDIYYKLAGKRENSVLSDPRVNLHNQS